MCIEAASKGGTFEGRFKLVCPAAVVDVVWPEVLATAVTVPEESPVATAAVIPAVPALVPAFVKVAVTAVLG